MENNKKKHKNYYKYHNNHNNYNKKNYQYYYKKKKNKQKKDNILLNREEQGEIINENIQEQKQQIQEETVISQQVVQEVLKTNDDYEELEFIPIKKKDTKKYQKRTKLMYTLGVFIIVAIVFGVSFSFFTYSKVDSRQADILSGEVYVRIQEQAVNLTLSKMYPRTNEEARARNDNYIDFTVKAKNTSPTNEITYSININNGENVQGKTRINPQYLILDLQEKVNNEYVYVKEAVALSTFSFTNIVPINTNSEITNENRLRIWVSDAITISDTDTNATYTQSEFANLYANLHIEVNSEDQIHVPTAVDIISENVITPENPINFANISSSSNGEGLYILPGTESDANPIYYYRGAINNNNVIFGDYCWQMVRTTDTGGIKMIYNGAVTGNGETCENTVHADRVLTNNSAFNSQYNTMADVGYMKNNNARYTYTDAAGASGSIYGKKVEWDGNNYLVIEDTANTASTNTTKDNNHHYSCGTQGTTSCPSVRYYYYNDYYITLTGGDFVEDAIYKMTGSIVNQNIDVVTRNSGYVLNNADSTIKTAIESWFRTNLTNEVDNTKRNFVSYLEDTVYCNDRGVKTVSGNTSYPTYQESGWNPSGGDLTKYLYFGTWDRNINNWYSTSNVPSTACPNETDRFSVGSSVAHLNYPVGLLTADEVIMAGVAGNSNTSNNTYYLYTGGNYWSLSPSSFVSNSSAYGFRVNSTGVLGVPIVNVAIGLRPVVSLKPGTEFESGGDGTPTKPYVVKYE